MQIDLFQRPTFLFFRCLHRQDDKVESLTKHFEVGDWKLMHLLSKNMEPLVFAEFIRELSKSFSSKYRGKDSRHSSSSGESRKLVRDQSPENPKHRGSLEKDVYV